MAATWECPPLPMISFSLKDGSKASFNALKPFIASQYDENPDSFTNEIRQLEQLRDASLKVSKDHNGCTLLRRYYAQLHLLRARFPQEAAGIIPIHFSWKDVYTGAESQLEGLQAELAPILYNIGALHSQVGSKNSRHSEQDMKEALTHYQCSAGAFAYINDNFGSSGQSDLSPQLVEMYNTLMLGQAQECVVEKSLKGVSKVKNLNISKISMKVAQYYQSVVLVLESDVAVSVNKKHKDWLRLLSLKISYYTAIAHLYQANSMEEQSNYGYMIAYQQLALEKIKSIGKPHRATPDVFKEAIKNLADFLNQKLQESLKQNEQVFHELVPDLETLEPAPGFELVKPYMFQPADPKNIGTDIFSRLVPMRAYEAASIYSEEQAKIMRSINSSVEQKNEELSTFMTSLNISELTIPTDTPSLPSDLMTLHRQFQSKGSLIRETESKIKELMSLSERVEQQLSEVAQMKDDETKDEKEFQGRHGARPESQVCSSLWKELDSMLKYHKQANNSNSELHAMFSQFCPNLLLLAGQTNTLVSAIPSLPAQDDPEETDKERLTTLLNKVEEMKTQRQELLDQLRGQMNNDDILHAMIGESSSTQGAVIEEYLQKPKERADVIRQNLTAQDAILKALTEANAKQAKVRQALQEVQKKREEWCVSLAKAAGNFTFLQSKISEGLVFYSKLAESVARLHKRSLEVCTTRRRERQSIDRHSPAPDKRTPSSSPVPQNKESNKTHQLSTQTHSSQSSPGHTPHGHAPQPSATSRDHTPQSPQGHTSQLAHPPIRPPKSTSLRGGPIQKDIQQQSNDGEAEGGDMSQLILEMKKNQEMQRANLNNTGTSEVSAAATPTATPPTAQGVSLLLDEPVNLSLATGLIEPVLIPQSVPIDVSQSLPPPAIQGSTSNQELQGPIRPSKPSHLQGDTKIDATTSQPVSTVPSLMPVNVQQVDTISTGPASPNVGQEDVTNAETETDAAFITTDVESVHVSITGATAPPLVPHSSDADVAPPPPITVESSSSPANTVVSMGPGNTGMTIPPPIPSTGPVIPPSISSTGPVIPPPISSTGPVIPPPIPSTGPVIPPPIPSTGPVIPPPIPSTGPVIPPPIPSTVPVIPPPIPSTGPVIPPPIPSTGPVIPPPISSTGPVIPSPISSTGPVIPSPISSRGSAPFVPLSRPLVTAGPVSAPNSDQAVNGDTTSDLTSSQDSESVESNVVESTGFSEVLDDTLKLSSHSNEVRKLPQFTAVPMGTLGMVTPTASPIGGQQHPILSISTGGVLPPPPPLSITSLQPSKELRSTPSHLENLCLQQQETIQTQAKQIEEQKFQLQQQSKTLEEQRKELERYHLSHQLQEKDKIASSSNQSMLVNLLKQQQELFKTQQEQMDKLSHESEAKRSQHSELEMKLRDALAQEQLQNQALHNQISQQLKDIQHLQHQLQASGQQIQSLQMQGQQYLNQIQERDKVLANYREEHKQIVDNLESQCRQRVQQITQQMQELQARVGMSRGGGGGGEQMKPMLPPPNVGGGGPVLQPSRQPQQQGWNTSAARPTEGQQFQQYPQNRGGGGVPGQQQQHRPQNPPAAGGGAHLQQHQPGGTRGPQNPSNSPGLSTQRVPVGPRQQGMPAPHPQAGQSSQSSSVMPPPQGVGHPMNQPTTNKPGIGQHPSPGGIQHPPNQPGGIQHPPNQPGGIGGISRYPSQPGVPQPGQPVMHHQPRLPSQQGVRPQSAGVSSRHALPLTPPTHPPTSDVPSPPVQQYPPYRHQQASTGQTSHWQQHTPGHHPTTGPHTPTGHHPTTGPHTPTGHHPTTGPHTPTGHHPTTGPPPASGHSGQAPVHPPPPAGQPLVHGLPPPPPTPGGQYTAHYSHPGNPAQPVGASEQHQQFISPGPGYGPPK
ncbi:PREDICTED: tyrosine-protein phosphatase non-receptor type 23-like isoform X1 [Amphimedon queenslandica]|uniref:BRO1 domain-containing protein n=1 Tax=Amphimedon queenslandica TaxID=400682 RepID=A0AAN0IXC5_AMPQE|nr:PREDICTED: tyrosine-protein phosphatase non-receptor type 23-like isoform X1 [Amphimedon queenslandica]|eukprot:XP_019849415.1 PREDICTED: tyrosine-protein phosphatase non-receptor type 23-like isoform X1 [Amphimedon queenslandica]